MKMKFGMLQEKICGLLLLLTILVFAAPMYNVAWYSNPCVTNVAYDAGDGLGGSWLVTAEWMQPAGCERYGADNSIWFVKAEGGVAAAPHISVDGLRTVRKMDVKTRNK